MRPKSPAKQSIVRVIFTQQVEYGEIVDFWCKVNEKEKTWVCIRY
jgi:hypothetical protein